ncbi:MAG: cache domain-containing protein, partial [Pseudomonadota bacterium]
MQQDAARYSGAAPAQPTYARRLRLLALGLGGLAVAAVLGGTTLSLWRMYEYATDRGDGHMLSLAQILGEHASISAHAIDALLSETAEHMRRVMVKNRLIASKPLHQHLVESIARAPFTRALLVSDASGAVILHTSRFPPPPINISDREYFGALRDRPESRFSLSTALVSKQAGGPVVSVSRRIDDRVGGRFLGVISAEIDADYLLGPQNAYDLGQHGTVRLLRRDGILLAGYPAAIAAAPANYRDSALLTQIIGTGQSLVRHTAEADSVELLSAIYVLKDYPLVVAATTSKDFILASWRRNALLLGPIAMVVAALLAVIALWLAHQLRMDQDLKSMVIQSQERLHAIIQSAMDAIITLDGEQRILLFNAASERVFRCPSAQAIGADIARFVPGSFQHGQGGRVVEINDSGATMRMTGESVALTGVRADGEKFPIEASISQVQLDGAECSIVILRDITERRRAEDKIRRSQQELHELSKAANDAIEAERRRTARELHDELGQSLTVLKMNLESMRAELSPHPQLERRAEGMHALLDGTIAATRRIAADLRPLMLDDLGLAAALDWLTHSFSQRTGIATDL